MINYESDNENFKIESLEPNLDNIDCVARFNTNLFLMILKFADKSE